MITTTNTDNEPEGPTIPPALPRLIRRPEVENKTGLTRSGIYDLIKRGGFPKPLSLGGTRCVAWSEAEVDAWIAEQLAAHAGRAAARASA